jgi:hypothetical protein
VNLKKLTAAFAVCGTVIAGSAFAASPYSKKAGEAYRALPDVKKTGTIYLRLAGNPKVLNPIIVDDVDATNVLEFLFSHLYHRDQETGQMYPELAEKVDVSKDHKVLTFTLRKEATWEDGTPITTDDVEFSFKTLMDPKVDAAPKRSYFEGYKFEKVDALTFKFTVEKPNVNTVDETMDDFIIVQKKQFAGVSDFNKAKGIMEPVSSGPYRLKSFSRDQKLELELKKNWWGFKVPELKNQHNFENIVFRIIPDSALSYEKFVKGEIDVYEMNAETYGTRIKGSDKDKFGTDEKSGKAMWAQHFMTKAPAPWTYIGWNLRRPVFASKKTRQALAQLINYDEIIQKVYHGEGIPCVSPFGSRTPNTAPDQASKGFKFNPAQGLALLKADGWSDLDQNNTLSKMIDGKKVKFEFTIRYNSENPMRAKIAQIIKEQFKKAGITANIQALEFNSLLGYMDNRDFDAVIMGWGKGNINSDSKQIWHSKSAENKGSNIVGYNNPETDKLIEQATAELDVQKHFKINQKIGALIYDDQPYAFLLEVPGFIAGFQNNKIKAKKWVMKFDDTSPISTYSAQP